MPAPRSLLTALLGACSLALLAGCGDDPFKGGDGGERPGAAAPRGAPRAAIDKALQSTVAVTAGSSQTARTGTGTVVAEGTVVTDRALVTGPGGTPRASVTVRDGDGNERAAIVDGTDELSGLATLRVRGLENVPAIRAGEEPAFAGELTAVGWVSAKRPAMRRGEVVSTGRAVRREGVAEVGLFESSANLGAQAVGGPLIDAQGRAVGISTRAQAPMVPGTVVALPIRSARRVATALRKDGRVRRAFLGIESVAVTPSRAEALRLNTARGLILRTTLPGSPSDFADLREPTGTREVGGRQIPTGGDIIVAVGNRKLAEPEDLDAVLATTPPGRELRLRVIRGSRSLVVPVRTSER